GYQISQYEIPVVLGGHLDIRVGETAKRVRLTRAHLEEDAGKSLHEDFHGMSGIDLNRAGTPLLEIVTEPDMRSSAEAVAYAKALHSLVRWIGICDGNMQEGSFRCDANVSVRRKGEERFGTRCEIKNLNSFRFLEQAIEYEMARQIEVLEDGGTISQETRLYDPDRNETRAMRSKEDAQDYRYFPDPDLLPLEIDEAWVASVRDAMPELPEAKRARFASAWQLSEYDAATLTASREMADYYEALVTALPAEPKLCANWLMGEMAARLNREQIDLAQAPVSAARLAALLRRIADGTLSGKLAREVFDALWAGEGEADQIIEQRGLRQISDSGELERIVDEVLAANPKSVEEFRAGKEKAFNALVGQAMKATRGKANPQQVNDLLRKRLG
ncbi:MAG: Asp-tRNA(Asn)/Glu-tRNA(Gln) amidotransferase subunit GatB, partial [Betaproteobacteria bacterium]|nr:Asp-tRNA(Asn)/Glu-tRNA(Gln) amidotransferase subunit GatB [Betaproteobacteria bacterium]